jgi:Flp pilus assembly protein TadG
VFVRHADRRPRREGAVLPWAIVSLAVVIGVLGLTLDGGRMMQERRRVQNAADAAALAAATELYNTYSQRTNGSVPASVTNNAFSTASLNGYANDGTNSVVTVNVPPQSGAFAGKTDYVEVIVQSNLSATFSASFTSGNLAIKARAVAVGRPLRIGFFALSPSGVGLQAQGNGSVQIKNATVRVDSSSSEGFNVNGNAQIQADANYVVGNVQGATGNVSGPIHTGADYIGDPLTYLATPDLSTAPIQYQTQWQKNNGTATLAPGIYQGGISIGGNASVTMQSGVYIVEGSGFSVGGNGQVTGSGVTIYYVNPTSNGSINLAGNGAINLTSPTSGPYQGISIFQDQTVTSGLSITGNGSTQVGGLVYAPGANVALKGNGSLTAGGVLANTINVSGGGNFTVDAGNNVPLIPQVNLVE